MTMSEVFNTNCNNNNMYCMQCHSTGICKGMKLCPESTVTFDEAEDRLKGQIQLAMSQALFHQKNLLTLKVHLDTFNENYIKCQEDIRGMANELIEKIREHEERLLQELDSYRDIEYKKCENSEQGIVAQENNLSELVELCNFLLAYDNTDFLEKFKQCREKLNILKLDMSGIKHPTLKAKHIQFLPVKCNTAFATLDIGEADIERPHTYSGRRQSLVKALPTVVTGMLPRRSDGQLNVSRTKGMTAVKSQPNMTRKLSLQIPPVSVFSPIYERPTFLIQTQLSDPSSDGEESTLWYDDSAEDIIHKEIWKIDKEGRKRGEISCPTDLTFLPDKTLVVADRENLRLQLFDIDGNAIKVIADKKIKPFRVDSTPDGKIVVSDTKEGCVKVYNKIGQSTATLGKKFFKSGISFKELCAVASMNGQFIISDLETNEVNVYNMDGKLIKHLDANFKKPFYIAADTERIYVSDNLDHCVKVFDSSYNFLFSCVLPNDGKSLSGRDSPNCLQYPTGVCTDSRGNIYVADWGAHTVSLFDCDGNFIQHLLTKEDGLYQPTGIAIIENYLAVCCYSETNSAIVVYKVKDIV